MNHIDFQHLPFYQPNIMAIPNPESTIDRIYEAAAIPELWPGVLDTLAELSGMAGGILFAANSHGVKWLSSKAVSGVMDAFVKEGWASRNVRAQRFQELNYSGFMTDLDAFTLDELDREPMYTELLRTHGFGWGMGTIIPSPSGDTLVFSFERKFALGPVPRSSVDVLEGLRPHLARSALLSARLHMMRMQSTVSMFQEIGLAAAVIGLTGRVLASNDLLGRMDRQVVNTAHGRLALFDVRANTLLKTAIEQLDNDDAETTRSIAIAAAGDQLAAVIHVIPVRLSAHDIFSQAIALLIITPMAISREHSGELLHGLFDLTPAEVRVANAVLLGQSLKQCAEGLQVSVETVRTQLRSVFAKTGTNRQAQLVRLLTGIPYFDGSGG